LKFLVDENVFPQVISRLRKSGHDVKAVKESSPPKTSDDIIIDLALNEKRTIITFDKHFGNIINYPPKDLFGIILIRIHPPLLDDIYYAIDNLFKRYQTDSFAKRLIVLSKTGYRIR